MKNRLNFIVLLAEILAIIVLHAAKMHHSDNEAGKFSIHSGMEKPDLSLKTTFTSFSTKTN